MRLRLKLLVSAIALFTSISQPSLAADCAPSGRVLQFSHIDQAISLPSPDREWDFISTRSSDPQRDAQLYILNKDAKRRWNIGSLVRNGTAFWSQDSRHLFLRDELAADDSRIRVFDLTGFEPNEINALDQTVRGIISSRLAAGETTLWIHYPQVCFASANTSEIHLTIDAHRVPGNEKGRDMTLRLVVHLPTSPAQELRIDTE